MAEAELRANVEAINNLWGLLNGIAKVDASERTSRKELEDLNFSVIRPVVEEAIYASQQLLEFPQLVFRGGQTKRLIIAAGYISSLLSELKHFSLRGNRPQERRDKILQEAESQFPDKVGVLSAVLAELRVSAFLSLSDLAPQDLLSRIKSVNSLIENTETVSQRAKDFATAAIVGRFGKLFEDLSGKYKLAAWLWFAAAVVSAVGVVIFAISIVLTDFGIEPGVSVLDATVLPRLGGRLVAISVLTSLWVWFARQHRVNRHLFVINKHRQTALESVKVILDSVAGSPENQQIVMRELARCVFSPGVTGYLGPEESAGSAQIVDLIRPLASK